jgi:hypothetical protein
MNEEFERIWEEVAMVFPNIYLEGLRNTTETLGHDTPCPS